MRENVPRFSRVVVTAACMATAGCQSPPFLIQWGWDEPDTRFLRERLRDMETTPFDGCVYHVAVGANSTHADNLAWQAWGRRGIGASEVAGARRDLAALRPRRFRHNFLRMNVTPGDVDWFDDFGSVVDNFTLAARLAREAGSAGIMFDTEQYEGQIFDYRSRPRRDRESFERYAAQARRRGRALMAAIEREHPDATIVLTFAYSLTWRDAQRSGRPLSELSYGLLPAFLDGMLDVARTTRVVDGYELSYGYRHEAEFAAAYRRMSRSAESLAADPARYRAMMSFAFGLWLDYDWREHGWHPTQLGRNYFAPAAFEASLRYALARTDEYVWIYNETPRWWSASSGSTIPAAYERAISAARSNPAR